MRYDVGMNADRTFNTEGRRLIRGAATGSLATLSDDGAPFASLVAVATTDIGEPILLLSNLAVHTRNLKRDPRASLLVVDGNENSDPVAGARLTLTGAVIRDNDLVLRQRFLTHHPEAAGYADFADFGFYRFELARGHLVAGFGRIVELDRSDLLEP